MTGAGSQAQGSSAAELDAARAELDVAVAAPWSEVKSAWRRRLFETHSDHHDPAQYDRALYDRVMAAWDVMQRHYGHSKTNGNGDDEVRRQVVEDIVRAKQRLERLRAEISATAVRRAAAEADLTDAEDRCSAFQAAARRAEFAAQRSAIDAQKAEDRADAAQQEAADAEERYAEAKDRADQEEERYRGHLRNRRRRRAGIAVVLGAVAVVAAVAVHRIRVDVDLSAPTGVTAEQDATGITVTWPDTYAGESGFEVKVIGDTGDLLLNVPANTTSARWALPAAAQTYCFQIRAYRDPSAQSGRWADARSWAVPRRSTGAPPWRETWVTPWTPREDAPCVQADD